MGSIIKLRDVSKLYGLGEATTVALEDVELFIDKGEFVAIMGPSGSGKTTLLNIIGLLDRPSHGLYQLDGRSVERLKPNARAKVRRDKIGFVFQSANLIQKMTVLDNVALPLTYKGRLSTRRLKIAHEMLERVGLADREYFYPHQLSGGQIQRAAIARALINDPTIIIADEPTGNLDSISSRMVMELLSDIHDMGNTVLMVTHNPELTRYASRVLYMYDGAIQHDVQKQVGVAATSRQTKLFAPEGSVEDDLQSVAAKMALEAEKESTKPQPVKTKRSGRRAKPKRKVKG
ncbi:MAG TPA: ABC transporter ATP-binding protein [Candidatus Saccharimonadales bacterium]|nr:ABC transporter ATP-binding protein [Candidatus Saccharimonadales bacterium]